MADTVPGRLLAILCDFVLHTVVPARGSLAGMTYPRSHLLVPGGGGVYHVQSRCVRRAWLCGYDEVSGRDFNHRRAWIERRILALAEIFAVGVYGYAVMSNHYHIVVRLEPERVVAWSDEEVVDRWLQVCPGPSRIASDTKLSQLHRALLLQDTRRLEVLRDRLSSLSWFMRLINEPLARMANREDKCTGRFWEGRFGSQVLLDEAAVLAAMAYVDLNPVRAGIADTASDSNFTSLRHRLGSDSLDAYVLALNVGAVPPPFSALTLKQYLALVQWTARDQSQYRRGMAHEPPEAIHLLGIDGENWSNHFMPQPGIWPRAVGSSAQLKAHARSIGQNWLCRPRQRAAR